MTEAMKRKNSTPAIPGTLIDPELKAVLAPFSNSQTVINEAEFGYRYIRRYLSELPPGARVLEVGSGPCVLLSQLSIDFPNLDVAGIEPVGPGFENFDLILQRLIDRFAIRLTRSSYEQYADPGRFDFIFLVNVFEHLPDWRGFLRFVAEKLEPAGRCVILCPNHGFPYEPHFSVPVIINKEITYRLFRKKIERHESNADCGGLWSSLNLVTWSEVRKQGTDLDLSIRFDSSVLRGMIERLGEDEEFAQRQKNIAFLAQLLLKSGVVGLIERPIFNRINPYMLLEITRCKSD